MELVRQLEGLIEEEVNGDRARCRVSEGAPAHPEARMIASRAPARPAQAPVRGDVAWPLLIIWQLSVGTLLNSALVAPRRQRSARPGHDPVGRTVCPCRREFERVIIGYVIGCLLGIFLGAMIGRYRLVADFLDPVLELIRPISPVAFVPLAMLWFGIGELSKYFIIIYATIVVVLLNTAAGVSRTPENPHPRRALPGRD